MSGVCLDVANRAEPGTTAPPSSLTAKQQLQRPPRPAAAGGLTGSLCVIELQMVAFIMVFSASGLVPLLDLAYPAFVSVYLLALSRLAFPSSSASSGEVLQRGAAFRVYVLLGTTVGLFLPLAYVLGGFAWGDNRAVRSAAPHLFLLACQILTENVVSGIGAFSPPVRALVPLLYTVRRVFLDVDWIHDVWLNQALPANAPLKDVAWVWLGKSLAVANLVYFSVNLFVFLVPRLLPGAFETYFKGRDEIRAKMSQDRRPLRAAAMKVRPAESTAGENKKSD